MTVDLHEARDAIRTREDLARFVRAMRDDLQDHPETWENPTIDRFLDAMAECLLVLRSYCANRGIPEPDQPDWALVGAILHAASAY